MSTSSLSTRINTLVQDQKLTVQLISRLSGLYTSQSFNDDDNDRDDAVRGELVEQIKDGLKEQEEELEDLQQAYEDTYGGLRVRRRESERDREGARLGAAIARLGDGLKTAHVSFRKAQLTASRSLAEAKARSRRQYHEALRNPTSTASRNQPVRHREAKKALSQSELEAQANNDITAALRRTHTLLASELSRSTFAQETLEESNAALAQLGESYTSLDGLLSRSKDLLGTLLRSQKSDTWYLETALYVLIATSVWLIYRRLLYGPLWWLLYLPLRLLYLTVTWILANSAVLGRGGAYQDASTAVSGASVATSLKIKPSATGRSPRRMSGAPQASVPVGRGGKGASGGDAQREGDNLAERVGKMAEESRENMQGRSQNEVERGDERMLRERREDEKPNPKKRMMEDLPRDEL